MVYVSIRLPQDTKWQPSASIGLINALVSQYGFDTDEGDKWIELQIVAYGSVLQWCIYILHEDDPNRLSSLIKTYYPTADVAIDNFELPEFPFFAKSEVFYRPKAVTKWMPLYQEASGLKAIHDPLIYVTQAMNNVEDSVISYHVILFSAQHHKRGFWGNMILNFIEVMQQDNLAAQAENRRIRREIDERLKHPLILCGLIVCMYTPDKHQFHLLDTVMGGFSQLGTGFGVFNDTISRQVDGITSKEDFVERADNVSLFILLSEEEKNDAEFTLTAEELACLWHLPHQEFKASKIDWLVEDKTCIPDALIGIEGIHIGTSCENEVKIPTDDRTSHTLIIGRTGTGKTSLMHRMIHEDLASGRGLCVIDPQGGLVSSILRTSIPDNRIDDVVILDLGMTVDGVHYPPPLNPLYKVAADEISMNVVQTLRRIEPEFAGTQMEYLLDLCLRTLGSEKQPTLRDIRRLFRDENYRNRLIEQTSDFDLLDDWEDVIKGKIGDKVIFPLLRRLRRLHGKNEVRVITCHPEPIDIKKLIEANKIILVNLSEQKDRQLEAEDRYLLGSAIVAQIERATMQGAIKERPYLLYIDETQNFVNTPISMMLAQVRQHGLGLILANQYLGQLTGATQEAVEGNVGTMISFEIGAPDERSMLHYMTTFERGELTSLGKYKAGVSMRYEGNRQPSFLVETLPPPKTTLTKAKSEKREHLIRQRSVANYTPKSYDEVIKILSERDGSSDNDIPLAGNGADNDYTEEDPKA